jgi:hypothetical protein
MKKSSEIESIKDRINRLEAQKQLEYSLLKDEFKDTIDHLKPSNLIKLGVNEISTSTSITNNMVNSALGLATGYVSKKILVGKSINPIKQALGLFLQFAVASVVAKNADTIKATGAKIINRIFRKKND